ncbi:MFS transporter [Streptomyces bluensis]|uniref:MFS transporter n=1 Tax=Streptomyces bluensis TaxID=33897 RepID=UPI00167895DA|nr:MFS transporter [Streptomyces bluensis]GGZ63848.1 MFS transporter [Streptomyces bluensis]
MKGPEPARALFDRGIRAVGGRARARVVSTLAATLAVDGADKGAVSAMAPQLRDTFGINNIQIGLLVSVVALSGAVFTIPVGLLADRTRRTRLLALSVTLWVAAMILAGASPSYGWLLSSRAALGAVSATAGPTIASLMGDYFPIKERARMYGLVLAGELVGTGLGFALSGSIGSFLTWRFAFWWLVIPGSALVWFLRRLPEPARGGQSRPAGDQEHTRDEREVPEGGERGEPQQTAQPPGAGRQDGDPAGEAARRARVEPHEHLVLDSDPREASKWWSVRYVLRVRTNVVLIMASALGYFYFTGLRSFATLYTTDHYGLSTSVATSLALVVGVGALGGVLSGGRIADRLLSGGRVNARALVPTVCMLTVPVFIASALYTTSLAVALPLLMVGTLLLGAANPPLDAARLDILPPLLWGTGEGVRTMLRTLCEAAAPTLFGYFSTTVFAGHGGDSGTALEYTLLFFLLTLVAAGLLGLVAMRSYPRDVATAEASTQRIEKSLRAPGERED